MSGRLRKLLKLLCFMLIMSSAPMTGQILLDTSALNLVKKDVDNIYNYKFKEAEEEYSKIVRLYPGHPIVYLLRGMMTYWQNYPMLHTSPSHVNFEDDMHECIKISEKNTNPAYAPEYLLADLCARGMLLMFYDDNDLIMEVTHLTMSTYKNIRRAFDFTSKSTDLFYFTGIYNYYRETFPKAYPVYRSLAFLFPRGNIETGLKQLQTAALNSIVIKAESASLLAWIYLSFENKLPESTHYCSILHENYPDNASFFSMYLRNLLLMKNYDETEKLISSYSDVGDKFFQAQLEIIKGILEEKKYRNYKLAEEYYNKGINDISIFGKYGNEYSAYAYFGLSRISDDNGEKHTRKTYRKEALKLADFKKINFDK